MCRHVRALQHLRKPTKRAHDTLQHLEGSLRALVHPVGQTLGVVRISGHATHTATIHAAAVAHTSVAPVPAAVHASAQAAEAAAVAATVRRAVRGIGRVGGRVCAAAVGTVTGCTYPAVRGGVLIYRGAEGFGSGWDRGRGGSCC